MLRKASPMSPRDAKLAEMQESRQAELKDRLSQLYVQLVVKRLLFLSSPVRTDLYTAASALQR
jgi:hypothetical protein